MEKYIKINGRYHFITQVESMPESTSHFIVTLKRKVKRMSIYDEMTEHYYFEIESLFTGEIEQVKILKYLSESEGE